MTNAGTVRLYCTNSSISFTTGELDLNSGDVVNIEMTPYDLTKGRITFRYKDKQGTIKEEL